MEGDFSGGDLAEDDRAYTRVDHGLVRVGNRWIERVWSGFTGYTTSLLDKHGEFEWAAAKNEEYSVDADGVTLGVSDFAEVEWSEKYNELGASILGVFSHEGLELRLEQLAFHEAPALLRTMTLFNSGRRKVEIGSVTTEDFVLDKPESCTYLVDLKPSGDSATSTTFNQISSVTVRERGLLILAESDVRIELGARELGVCSVLSRHARQLSPSQSVTYERSLLIAFEGDVQAALERYLPDIEGRLRLHECLIARREREEE